MNKSLIALTLAATAGAASANLTITEIWSGLSGEDGTVDWFEVTNTGAANVDTGLYLYDDVSADLLEAVSLPSFILAPGESAVILLEAAPADGVTYATALEEFTAIWGGGINVGVVSPDGAGLGQGGDTVNIFLGGSVVDSLSYTAAQSNVLETIENDINGVRLSVLGENGAFASASFFNDNLGLPGNSATLIGSPGFSSIPAPAALSALALAGLAGARRRR